MNVITPGHLYELAHLDDAPGAPGQLLRFVKRVGDGYPGNTPPTYAGTNMQEVLRVLIDRLKYVRDQAVAMEDRRSVDIDSAVLSNLQMAFYWLELRAAERHGRTFYGIDHRTIDTLPWCAGCGHVECAGACGRVS